MVINKKSWHYQVYEFTYWGEHNAPLCTNLCQYVRRIVFIAPIMGAFLVFVLAVLAIIILCCLVLFPIAGYVPSKWSEPWNIIDGLDGRRQYQGLKLGRAYNAFQVYPWHVLLALVFVGIEWLMIQSGGWRVVRIEGEILGLVAGLVAVGVGVCMYIDSDASRVVRAYFAAKKQKICPVVDFEDKE